MTHAKASINSNKPKFILCNPNLSITIISLYRIPYKAPPSEPLRTRLLTLLALHGIYNQDNFQVT